jgi:NAD/NADP transhydrogenase beta subunit
MRSIKYATVALLAGVAALALSITACNTTQQRTVFTTLGSLESTATAGVDGYFLAAVKGLADTNGIPKVSALYNKFQVDMQAAVLLAQNNTNALATTNLVAEAGAMLSAVAQYYPVPKTQIEKVNPTP